MQKLIRNVDQNLFGIYRSSNSKEDRKTLQSFRRQNLLKHKEYLNGSITPNEYEKWLKEYVKPTLKPKSYESYSSICHELMEQFGHVKLNSLSALMLLSHYNYLRDRGNT